MQLSYSNSYFSILDLFWSKEYYALQALLKKKDKYQIGKLPELIILFLTGESWSIMIYEENKYYVALNVTHWKKDAKIMVNFNMVMKLILNLQNVFLITLSTVYLACCM